ncbi:MAG: lysylphosphatidylglycerol synthase transmembrane domain-containing protein, partial [Chloroflexota bacterium]|nr:lysylphosphatidylglycerol synthase transmembrane domain-containing protein [Chloroflexota bacterium]
MRRLVLLFASVAVSAIFLWLALRGVPLQEVVATIGTADPVWLAIGLATVPLGLAARAMRWSGGLLEDRLSAPKAFHILNIGMLLNQLPLRAGEVARGVLAARDGVPFVTAATSIVVERLIDVVVCVLLLTIGIARVPDAPPLIAQISLAFGMAAVLAFVVLVALARSPVLARRLLTTIETRLPFLSRFNLTRRADEV